MISFEQKVAILETFPELSRKDVSLGRVNFQFEQSATDKKNVVYHLHPNGNGYIYADLLDEYEDEKDDKGYVNIRDYSADELRTIVGLAIRSLSVQREESRSRRNDSSPEERWNGPDGATLVLKHEDDLWYVFSGLSLEMAFETYEEAVEYMQEEGFQRKSP